MLQRNSVRARIAQSGPTLAECKKVLVSEFYDLSRDRRSLGESLLLSDRKDTSFRNLLVSVPRRREDVLSYIITGHFVSGILMTLTLSSFQRETTPTSRQFRNLEIPPSRGDIGVASLIRRY